MDGLETWEKAGGASFSDLNRSWHATNVLEAVG